MRPTGTTKHPPTRRAGSRTDRRQAQRDDRNRHADRRCPAPPTAAVGPNRRTPKIIRYPDRPTTDPTRTRNRPNNSPKSQKRPNSRIKANPANFRNLDREAGKGPIFQCRKRLNHPGIRQTRSKRPKSRKQGSPEFSTGQQKKCKKNAKNPGLFG